MNNMIRMFIRNIQTNCGLSRRVDGRRAHDRGWDRAYSHRSGESLNSSISSGSGSKHRRSRKGTETPRDRMPTMDTTGTNKIQETWTAWLNDMLYGCKSDIVNHEMHPCIYRIVIASTDQLFDWFSNTSCFIAHRNLQARSWTLGSWIHAPWWCSVLEVIMHLLIVQYMTTHSTMLIETQMEPHCPSKNNDTVRGTSAQENEDWWRGAKVDFANYPKTDIAGSASWWPIRRTWLSGRDIDCILYQIQLFRADLRQESSLDNRDSRKNASL